MKNIGCLLILIFIGLFVVPLTLWNMGASSEIRGIATIIATLGLPIWYIWRYDMFKKRKEKKDEVRDNDEEDKSIDKPPKPKDDEPFGFG